MRFLAWENHVKIPPVGSVNDAGDGNGIGEQIKKKINEITELVKMKRFKKRRKVVLRLLNELFAMTEECEAPPTPEPGRKNKERVGLTSFMKKKIL